ncbi:ABC transporter permease [Microbulbifer thermotolerans]|uniref:ABC transporter permease n=1 Tax=Microbulbifer thermotolerans TaxID=252514 RepID=UPI00224B504D|nr:ABC transporter permease [Microbulbifer thermotolerans]MCX2836390.1 ABC transporter permease [Microbulbifer thermotolerans]
MLRGAWFSSPMGALVRKEFLETWRDKRALWTAVSFSLIFPVMLFAFTTYMVKQSTEEPTRMAFLGGDRVPLLAERLSDDQFQVEVLSEGKPRELLESGYDLVLELSEDFVEDYVSLRSAKVYLYLDSADIASGRAQGRLQERLGKLQQLVVSQRLSARGVAQQLLSPWNLQVRDVSTPSSRGAIILAAVPGLLILTLFVASLATSVDTSAGERERLSLETLLLQPLPGWQLVAAKVLAVASMGWMGALLALAALVSLMPMMPLAELGIQQAATVGSALGMGLLLLPLALLVAVVQILLALRSNSFKDAQTQLSILQIAPAMLLVVLDVSGVQLESGVWQLVPLVAQQQWLKALLVGDPIFLPLVLAGSLVSLLMAVFAVALGARALRRERLLNTG